MITISIVTELIVHKFIATIGKIQCATRALIIIKYTIACGSCVSISLNCIKVKLCALVSQTNISVTRGKNGY